jgi:hypothetical protein
MENEILWKWELLCNEFEEAKQNYINTIEPIIKIAESDEHDTDRLFEHLKNAVQAWNFWLEVQDRIKKFVEENS